MLAQNFKTAAELGINYTYAHAIKQRRVWKDAA